MLIHYQFLTLSEFPSFKSAFWNTIAPCARLKVEVEVKGGEDEEYEDLK